MSQSTIDSVSASSWAAGASVESRIGVRLNLFGALCRAAEAVLAWRERAHERGQLAAMDARLRKDIGLTSVDVWSEVNKPFWRG